MRACIVLRKVAAELQNDRRCKQEGGRSMGEVWRLLSSCGECLVGLRRCALRLGLRRLQGYNARRERLRSRMKYLAPEE
jgi:hypothetical protein